MYCIDDFILFECQLYLRFLQDADVIIFMVDGQIQCIGRPADVLPLVETEQVLHVASLADSENGQSTSRTVKSSEEEVRIRMECSIVSL